MPAETFVDDVWRPMDYEQAWAPFDQRFEFRPDFHERTAPAIEPLGDSLVLDLSTIFADEGPLFAAGQALLNASALRAFVRLAGGEDLTALDWQHTPYKYSPAHHALAGSHHWPVPVCPDGDYYIHFPADLAWGTFGHPWQQTLTLWGSRLIEVLGTELLTWLPRHPQSGPG